MLTLTAAGTAVFGALTVVNLLLCFAIIRRLRSSSPAVAASAGPSTLPAVGDPVGRFSTATVRHTPVDDAAFGIGTRLAIFLSPGCPPCQDLTKAITDGVWLPEGVVAFIHGDADSADTQALVDVLADRLDLVVDEYGAAARAFGISAYPSLVEAHDGAVAAAGHRLTELNLGAPPIPAGLR